MDYNEFQRHVGKAGLKMVEFAALMQMNSKSLSNYRVRGEVPLHLAFIAVLLGEMAERAIDFRTILSKIQSSPKAPRTGMGHFAKNKNNESE